MPSKKKKYNARFPPARIKKIMQSDEEVGKVAQAVPVIISRALELFVESLLKKAETVTQARNAKTLTPSHLKQCIMSESRFDFLKDMVATVPDVQGEEDLAETPTPRSSASNQAFLYPPVSAVGTGTSSNLRNSGSIPPTSSLGAPPDQQAVKEESEQHEPEQPYEPPRIADYAQDLPFSSQPVQKSVIVTQQQLSSGHILNPAGVTSNPYIPNISGTSHPGISGTYPIYSHHPYLQAQNPNGMTQQNSGAPQSVIVYEDKNVSHHHHYQQH